MHNKVVIPKVNIRKIHMSEASAEQDKQVPLNEKVLNWLNKQGYPLEMEVASMATQAGFDVLQSEHFTDPETEESREIDLEISRSAFSKSSGSFLCYKLFVECKTSKAKPWLVFSTPVTEADLTSLSRAFDAQMAILCSQAGVYLIDDIFSGGEREKIYPTIFTPPWLGYGVTQAFADGNRVPFEAMMSATKACIADMKALSKTNQQKYGIFYFTFPVVVTDAPLYSVSYCSISGEMKLEEIAEANLQWKHMIAGFNRMGVFIVNKQTMPTFLQKCKESADWLFSLDDERLNKAREKLKR